MSHLQRLWQRFASKMNPPVFLGSAAVVIAFVAFGTIFTRTAHGTFDAVQSFIVDKFGWFYILSASVLLLFVLWLLVSRFGRIRLGGEGAEPEFGLLSWFSMMMAAGMGIGIVFFGVREPLWHFTEPPPPASQFGAPRSDEALRTAMRFTFYHWGLHPWAIYSALALPLAYFHFRHKLPLAPRSLLYPLIGDRIHGWPGHVVDVMCTVGTLFGVATSLGLGAIQINTGLAELTGAPETTWFRVALIAGITAIATVSVVSGIHVGVRRLSEFNIGLAGLILVFVLVAGPTLYVVQLFVSSIGHYLQNLPSMSFWINPDPDSQWQADWTLFYWSWWISWSPFVGVFVARISKGRTIREFIIAAFLVPTLMGFFWFSVIGGTGLHMELSGRADIAKAIHEADSRAGALYAVLGALPAAKVMWGAATLLIVVFFITSSDSGSLVDDMVTSGGHPNPPKAQRVFWACSEGAVAITLLVAGAGALGETAGLKALRWASLTTGLPMAAFLLVASAGLVRALRVDYRTEGLPEVEALAGDAEDEEASRG